MILFLIIVPRFVNVFVYGRVVKAIVFHNDFCYQSLFPCFINAFVCCRPSIAYFTANDYDLRTAYNSAAYVL